MINKTPLLSIQNLVVEFSTHTGVKRILNGVSFDIFRGEIVALVGTSGCGKSMTAQAIMQLLAPGGAVSNGEIWFDGDAIHSATTQQMQKIRGKKMGMIFQDPMSSLNPTMRIGRQISEMLTCHQKISHQKAKQRTLELLHLVNIADPQMRYHTYPFELSGGMRQRVMIAMALACCPQLLIADEPTTALDVTVQAQILQLLLQMQQTMQMSLLLITHDMAVVAETCDRVAVMEKGQIIEIGTVQEVLTSPKHPYTKKLLDLACRHRHH